MGYAINADWSKEMDPGTRFHRFRYHLAKGFIDVGDRVLDLGCGQGYGTKILSEVALTVLGVDLEPSNIIGAKEKYNGDNIDYFVEDLEKWHIPECDVAVEFENLEHLYDPKRFVDKLKKKVSKFIIMSTPVGCEKLVTINGVVQADLDSEHHSVFDTPEDVKRLFINKHWREFWSMKDGVTFIGIFYKL